MGCVPSEKKSESKLTSVDYRIIWSKCLNTRTIELDSGKRRDHPVFTQIAKDIDRTFPGHPFLNEPENKRSFEWVLQKFALYFPKMGYTQGINFIAGYLLVNDVSEEQTLRMLIGMAIHPELMLIGLFQDDFPMVRLQCELFWITARKICPEGYRILKEANLPDQLWLFQWFLTLFIYSFPREYIKEFLTFIVVKKYFAAVRLAVAILQCLEKYILGKPMKDDGFIECFELLKTEEFCFKYLPLDGILKRAQKITNQSIMNSLAEVKTKNWYSAYFSMPSKKCQKEHEQILALLKKQRDEFHKQTQAQQSRYTRLSTSMNIIDSIEDQLIKRYEYMVYRSDIDRNTVFFSRLSQKKYQSVTALGSKSKSVTALGYKGKK